MGEIGGEKEGDGEGISMLAQVDQCIIAVSTYFVEPVEKIIQRVRHCSCSCLISDLLHICMSDSISNNIF